MTIWIPDLTDRTGPLYQSISDAIARDIETGQLEAGAKLPPQRDLADAMGIALTTVTRGYAEAERKGLVSGEVGRGTFVRRERPHRNNSRYDANAPIDMTANSLLPYPHLKSLSESISSVILRLDPLDTLDYQPVQGGLRPRRAGAKWMSESGLAADPENVLISAGAQHGILVVLSALTNPGDSVLVEEVTYSGVKSTSKMLNLKLVGVGLDSEGMRPDQLRAAIKKNKPKAIYTMPALQNPSGRVMSPDRRKAIAEIADEAGVPVVEDDSYGFLIPEIPPLSTHSSNAYYINGTSKSLASGLRIGFIHCPSEMVDRLAAAICATTWMASPLLAEVVADWIFDGTASEIIAWKREESAKRQELAQSVLGEFDCKAHPMAQHLWLRLPEPWSAGEFVAQAQMRGVLISAAEDFATNPRLAPHSVRICISTPISHDALRRGLEVIAEILNEPAEPCNAVL